MMKTLLLLFSVACASTRLSNFKSVGNANWTEKNGVISANSNSGYLVTKKSYDDFSLELEFRATHNSNSGVFFRCDKSDEISDQLCYEANIFDLRPDQTYRTGGLVTIQTPAIKIDTEDGQWHRYEITA